MDGVKLKINLMDPDSTLRVNKFARRERHMRVFSKTVVLRNYACEFLSFCISPLLRVCEESAAAVTVKKYSATVAGFVRDLLPTSPQKKLLSQAAAISIGAIFLMSFSTTANFTSVSASYSTDRGGAYSISSDVLVADEYGYLIKMNPQTHASNRIGLTDYAVHTVVAGETLSTIAQKYGLSSNTIKWENNISNANAIRIGQSLLVPPVDGIGYTVKRGDSLGSIAKQYNVKVESIIAQNSLASETIRQGQSLFLPGAEPLAPPPVIAQAPRNATVSRDTRSVPAVSAAPSSAAPVAGRPFIYPTTGNITQGYRAGHYALDIANRSRPPVWSAGGGTVVTASSGTWAGGYGNHVIIDHGNGLRTLYAHLGSVNVSSGQWVNQGDVIGMMGNTGRVYGATGIHLHWEVHLNGVRQNPRNYY